MSPVLSRNGSAPIGSSQQVPLSTMWNPAPSVGGKRRPQGARIRLRFECGRPVRIVVTASLSTSMVAIYPTSEIADDRAWIADVATWFVRIGRPYRRSSICGRSNR
jgi:hypothetical protein